MPGIPRFAIFYGDGSIVEGGGDDDEIVEITLKVSKKWLEASPENVQAVVSENPYSCRYVWRDADFYYMSPNHFEVCKADDLSPFITNHLGGFIKRGLCIHWEDYEKILTSIKKYDKISRKCNRRPRPDEDIE